MGIVLAFIVGYAVGARAGQEGYEDLTSSMRAVRDSEEFHGLLRAVRAHAGATLRELSVRLEGDQTLSARDFLDRMTMWIKPAPTSGAS